VSAVGATPRVAVAAAAAGRAVAAVVHHPAADLMRHGVDGVVVPGADPVRLPPAVLEMLGSGAALAAMGGAARERWTREHSPRARAERLAALYDAVAAERSTPEPGAGR
jgi:glycosyltransferase involved in cell wall biosynthesis